MAFPDYERDGRIRRFLLKATDAARRALEVGR